MDSILGTCATFTTPFQNGGQALLGYLEQLRREGVSGWNPEVIAFRGDLEFFIEYFTHAHVFMETLSWRLADTIRRTTMRPDIRRETTDILATRIRQESFGKFEAALATYAAAVNELGVKLEDASSIRAAIQGAIAGGGLQLLLTNLSSSRAGTIIGGVIGASIEELKKAALTGCGNSWREHGR